MLYIKIKTMAKENQIKKRITYDCMSITANLISGAFLKYKINRNGESLELGFSNDRAILKEQTSKMAQWLKLRDKETNQDVFNRLEKLLQSSKSGAEVISNLEKF